MPISGEIKEIVACENLRCPDCAKEYHQRLEGFWMENGDGNGYDIVG